MSSENSVEWSSVIELSDYTRAPKAAGLYMIGLHQPSRETFDKKDDGYGANFPIFFDTKYFGISNWSVRERLYRHFRGRGNAHIKTHIKECGPEDLRFVYCATNQTEVEHLFVALTGDGFPWNVRKTEIAAFLRKVAAPPADPSILVGLPSHCPTCGASSWKASMCLKCGRFCEE